MSKINWDEYFKEADKENFERLVKLFQRNLKEGNKELTKLYAFKVWSFGYNFYGASEAELKEILGECVEYTPLITA